MLDVAIGRNLRRLRELRALSRDQLASLVGIDVKDIADFEDGGARVAPLVMYDLAVAMEVPVSAFFEGVEPKTAPDPAPPSERRVH
jgi:transcriptional regulator with XRE-family HTH domain